MFKPTTKKKLYLVRHGESEHNIAPVFQDDSATLSDLGVLQAEAIADRMTNVDFQALISSHLMRARQTAEAIALKTNKTIETNELLRERILPASIKGMPYSDTTAWETFLRWERSQYDQGPRVEDGETFHDIYSRAKAALEWLSNYQANDMVVVSHGNFMRFMIMNVLFGDTCNGEQAEQFIRHSAVHNTSVTLLKLSNSYEYQEVFEWRLVALNDFAHFAE